MARRRKIPVRKHHGIRDPLKQLEDKEKKLKNVVNNAPQGDDQRMSYKFMQFKKLADQAKSGRKIKRIHSGVEDKPKVSLYDKKKSFQEDCKKFKKIKQMPGEEDSEFMKRVNRITSESLKEAQYEAKYGVKVIRNPKTGEIVIKKKPPNEIDELLKQRRRERNRKIGKKQPNKSFTKPVDPKLVKELIKQAIDEEKEKDVVEYREDVVKFGEVVHAPPNISTIPRKAQRSETVPRPGRKTNLLLKELLNPTEKNDAKNSPEMDNKKRNFGYDMSKSQLNGKRKNLPEATRHMLETERQKIVNLYRELKNRKNTLAIKANNC